MRDLNAPESAIQYNTEDSNVNRTHILTIYMSFQLLAHRSSRVFEIVIHPAIAGSHSDQESIALILSIDWY